MNKKKKYQLYLGCKNVFTSTNHFYSLNPTLYDSLWGTGVKRGSLSKVQLEAWRLQINDHGKVGCSLCLCRVQNAVVKEGRYSRVEEPAPKLPAMMERTSVSSILQQEEKCSRWRSQHKTEASWSSLSWGQKDKASRSTAMWLAVHTTVKSW
jgi:hypothetical protein